MTILGIRYIKTIHSNVVSKRVEHTLHIMAEVILTVSSGSISIKESFLQTFYLSGKGESWIILISDLCQYDAHYWISGNSFFQEVYSHGLLIPFNGLF